MKEQRGPTPEDVGRIVRWAIMLFFAYALISHAPKVNFGGPATPPEGKPSATKTATAEKSKDCETTGSIFNNFSLFALPLRPLSSPSIAISELKEGDGAEATCGQRATLRYSYSTRGGDVIFTNMEKGEPEKDVLIGGSEILQGLERGLIGMKVGGERDITMARELGFYSGIEISQLRNQKEFKFAGTNEILTARTTLLSITPPIPASTHKLRQLQQIIGSDGPPAQCGNKVYLHLSLWKLDGTQLFSTEGKAPLKFQIGKSQIPYGVEQGIIGMSAGGQRTLIIPPEWMTPLIADAPDQLLPGVEIPRNEIILATVGLVDEPKLSPTPAAKPAEPQPPHQTKPQEP